RDALDPLRDFRERFALPRDAHGEPLIYLCGHSLGLLPLAARELVIEELDEWARLGVQGHEHARRPWVPYHENLTAALAALSGAHPSEVVAMNSLTVNLHLMLASFYRPTGRRSRILMEAGAFSSDRHAVASQIAWHGLDPATALLELAPRAGEDTVPEEAIDACLREHGEEIALVLWPGVQFRTAAGAAAWQISNPPILAAAPLLASLAIFTEARMERLRAKSVQLSYFLEQLLQPLAEQVHLITPREKARRGCQLSLRIAGGA